MSKSIYQHIVPRVYLKYFSLDNFVHVYKFHDPYRKTIQRKGIGDKIFCQKRYYDFPNKSGTQHVENKLSGFEGYYNEIMQRLEAKTNLNYNTKHLIINWLHISKIRSDYFRSHASDLIGWIEKTSYGLQYGAEAMKAKEAEFISKGKIGGKIIQLDNFLNQKYFNETIKDHSLDFLKKKWVILVSLSHNFITSDNPGFSYTLNEDWMRVAKPPTTSIYNLNDKGVITHFFPFSPIMCLCAKNQLWPPDVSEGQIRDDILSDITFETAPSDFVDFINRGTIDSSHSIVISKHPDDLKRYININE